MQNNKTHIQAPKIAVVILNWNGKEHLKTFLPSVVSHSQHEDVEIIVADNGSTDDSIAFLKQHYPDIRLILFEENMGFAKGYNEALKLIDSEYYVLLNSDVEVTPNWILPIIDIMEKEGQIAAIQPKILSYTDKSKFEYAGAAGGFMDKYGYPFCRGRLFDKVEEDYGQYDDTCDIFWATGACLFVRATCFHEVGGFDDEFFAHMEEIDLCWRLQLSNYTIKYVPDISVYHLGGGSLPKSSPFKTYLNIRNNKAMLYKNLPKKQRGFILAVRLLLDMVAALKFLVGKNGFQEFKAVVKAHFDFLKMKPELKRKRAQLTIQASKYIYKKNIVWQYYALGKQLFSNLSKADFS